MPDNRKLFIVIGILSVILVVLIVVSSLIGSFMSERSSTPTSQITPVPRQRTGGESRATATGENQLSPLITDTSNLTQNEQSRIRELAQRMPVSTADFDLDYSPSLNTFFADIKTDNGEDALAQYLQDNGLGSIAEDNPNLVIQARKPVGQQIAEAEETVGQTFNLLEEDVVQAQNSQPTPTPLVPREVTLFTNIARSFVNFSIDPGNPLETFDETTATQSSTSNISSLGSTNACDAGTDAGAASTRQGSIVHLCRVQGFTVNSTIAGNIDRLLTDARSQGITLGGSAFRSYESQISLRRAHCGLSNYDIYQKPSRQCRPPTARPGNSMHEQGLAIDFNFRSRSHPSFVWLARNASRYGLSNLPSEPWHWSTNGR